MAYGFKVINDYGTVLIDDTFANLALMSSAVYTTTPPASQYYGSDLIFSFSAQFPVFAFRCETALATVVAVQQNGSAFTVSMRCDGPVGTPIKVYFFDRPTVPTSGWGIRVRDAAGNITFDSGYSYMRIVGAYSGADATWALPAGKVYAVLQGGYYYTQYWLSPAPPTDPNARGDIITEVSGVRVAGNVMQASIYKESNEMNQPFFGGAFGGTASYLLIDVTNM